MVKCRLGAGFAEPWLQADRRTLGGLASHMASGVPHCFCTVVLALVASPARCLLLRHALRPLWLQEAAQATLGVLLAVSTRARVSSCRIA